MLKIYTLGKSVAYFEDEQPLTFRTRKAEAILYYLIVTAKAVDRTELAELFWSDMTTSNAQKNLRTVLPDLRSLLGDLITITNQDVAFNKKSAHWVDLYQLYELLNNAWVSEEEKLTQFLELYQGELLNELNVPNVPGYEIWLQQQRESLKSLIVETMQQLSESFLEQDAFKLGLDATQVWLNLQPWNENAHRIRMQLFWRSRQRSAALLQYNQCFDYLEEELGVEPSPETKKLYIQIQNDAIPLANDQKKTASPPPKRPKYNLPTRFTTFVGREQEIETLITYLLDQKHPLVSILGEGGVGKTRLALAVAERLVADPSATPFSDGVWFISCAGIDASLTAPEQLVIHIGTAIGIQFQGRKPLSEQLTDYLFNKSMLLVLDNFEHLSEHIPLLLSWVELARNLQLLVTSRHTLNIQSDLYMRLNGLEVPPFAHYEIDEVLSEEELSRLLMTPSVQILNDRARKVWPLFVVDPQNGVAVAKLCKLLDGNPLALELTATLVIDYDPATIYKELTHNYTLLASDLQDLPLRQRSIHNAIDYSWRLLPAELTTLLAQCSAFRATFTYQAITTITAASPRSITQLVHRSLLHADDQRDLHIHETVRQFAAEKLAQNRELQLAIHQKHSEYYIGLLVNWWENPESKHIVTQLLPHLDNIYAAWEWAFNHQLYGLLSHAIIPFTQFHIYAGLVWNVLLLINTTYQKLQASSPLAPDHHTLSPNAGNGAHLSQAESYHEMHTALTYASGVFHHHLGNYEQATEYLRVAQAAVFQHGLLYLAANIEHYLANICRLSQLLERAKELFALAIRHAEEQKQPYTMILSRLYLAVTANQQGQPEEGMSHLQQATLMLRQHPDVSLDAMHYDISCDIYHAQGRWSDALASSQKKVEINLQQRYPSESFHTIGKIFWQSGRFELAKEYLERVDSTNRSDLYRPGRYWHTVWLLDFANLYVAWQQPEQALFYSQLARSYAQKQGQRILLGRAMKAAGAAQVQLRQWDIAEENLTQALALFRRELAFDHECTALTQLIHLYIALYKKHELISTSQALWDILHSGKLDMTNAEPIKAWWACSQAFEVLGDPRAKEARITAYQFYTDQLANIQDETWRLDFANRIPEHQSLQRAMNSLAAIAPEQ